MTAPSVSLEPRRAIALPPSYAETQRRVEILVGHDVPLQRVDSVSSDLRLGEHGLLAFATAASGGAVSGVSVGLPIGLVLWTVTPAPFVSAVLIGLGVGAWYGVLARASTAGNRDIVFPRPLNAVQGVVVPAGRADGAWTVLAAGRTGATAFSRPAS